MSTPKSERTRVIVVGATGRIGSRLCEAAHLDPHFELVAGLCSSLNSRDDQRCVVGDDRSPLLQTAVNTGTCANVVIDFSTDAGARAALQIADRCGASALIGTTALTDDTRRMIDAASRRRAVLVAANTSLGIAVLCECVRLAAGTLGARFDCSIVESHHKHKKDAPSGTALALARVAVEAGAALDTDQILAMRGGDVVGEHTVRFAGAGEVVELAHRVLSRDVFVQGALAAAKWLHGRAPGLYAMTDVIDITPIWRHDRERSRKMLT